GRLSRWISRFDYVFAMAMHYLWLGQQLNRVRRVRKLRDKHPFFAAVASAFAKLDALPLRRRIKIAGWEVPFLSELFRPARHRSMRVELQRNRDFSSLPKPLHFLRSSL